MGGMEQSEMLHSEHGPMSTLCSPSQGGGQLCDLVEKTGADEGRSDTSCTGNTAKLFGCEPVVNMQF